MDETLKKILDFSRQLEDGLVKAAQENLALKKELADLREQLDADAPDGVSDGN